MLVATGTNVATVVGIGVFVECDASVGGGVTVFGQSMGSMSVALLNFAQNGNPSLSAPFAINGIEKYTPTRMQINIRGSVNNRFISPTFPAQRRPLPRRVPFEDS